MAYQPISHVHLSVSYSNQVIRLLLWGKRGTVGGQGEGRPYVKSRKWAGRAPGWSAKASQVSRGRWFGFKTQLAHSGVGGNEGVLLKACHFREQRKTKAWNLNGLWPWVRDRGNEGGKQRQRQRGWVRVAEAGRCQGCRVEGRMLSVAQSGQAA